MEAIGYIGLENRKEHDKEGLKKGIKGSWGRYDGQEVDVTCFV